jgi:HlyD family secretion protein
VLAVIDLTGPPRDWAAMGDGFRVVVRVITTSVDDALVVPVGALFPHGDGLAVYAIEAGRARLRVVDIGGRNGNEAWVRSGLAAGQQVVVYPPPTVAEGRRVRVRQP